VLMALSDGYTLAFSRILQITLRSESFPFVFYIAQSHDTIRVLLATMRDKGLRPCPRCFVLKSKIDQTGTKRDAQFRKKNVRKYLLDFVHVARDAIYRRAAKISGAVVNRLLKPTSSVPTLVSFFYVAVQKSDDSFGHNFRMHLLIVLERILRSHGS
jgi:hypothetical protein